MSIIGVDARTYALAHSRTYSACLNRCRDMTEAKRLAAYYMRDWHVVEDAPRAVMRSIVRHVGQARRDLAGEPVRFECGSTSPAACPMKPDDRPPKIKRRQLIPGGRWVILPKRCA